MSDYNFSIDDVLKLRDNPSEEAKVELIGKLQGNFSAQNLAAQEKEIADEILRYLAADISSRIRQSIAEQFSESTSLPYDVALKLAHDLDDFVALPVISNSTLLNEADLINIVRNGNDKRQVAVAKRPNLSENVNGTIIAEAAVEAVETLLTNKHSVLSDNNKEQLIRTHGSNQVLIKSLIENQQISVNQAHDLLVRVSGELQNTLIKNYNIPKETVSKLIESSKEWVVLGMIRAHAENHPHSIPLNDIITRLHNDNEISFSLLVKALSLGNLTFFEAAIAKMAGLHAENVRKLLWDSGDNRGYEGLYEKCGLPDSMKDSFYKLLTIVHEDYISGQDVEKAPYRIFHKITSAANTENIENIDYLVTIVGHNIKKTNIS